jgi:hypothetical protein
MTGGMSQRRHEEAHRAFAWAIVCALVLLVAWTVALRYVPEGWPQLAVHGGGYMLSIVVMAGGYDQLKRSLKPFHAFLIAAASWAVLFVALRAGMTYLVG